MDEKKLTDEEVLTAIEKCFAIPMKCEDGCPYFNKNGRNFCVENKAFYKDLKRIATEHADQKAEIERLTEERNEYKGLYVTMYRKYSDLNNKEFNCEALRKERNEYLDKAVELQKQVDELKEELEKAYETERANIRAEIADAGTSCHWCERQTVKDTAKEILEELEAVKQYAKDTYGVAEKVGVDIAINVVKKIFKNKGVEVE